MALQAKWETGQQTYFLDVPGAPGVQGLSIQAFVAREELGEPYRIEIDLTSQTELLRTNYLSHPATFTIEPPAMGGAQEVARKFQGCITEFGQTRKTHDFTAYRIVVEPLVARLRLAQATRIYQQQSVPEIIEAILRRQGFRSHEFSLQMHREHPRLAFRMQYQMSDWSYIRLLMEQHGLYCYFRAGQYGDVLNFGDDIDAYTYRPQVTIPYREVSGLETGNEAVLSLQMHSRLIAKSVRVADYNAAKAYERFSAQANVAGEDPSTWGQPYVFGTNHLDGAGAQRQAQLRHEAQLAGQIIYTGRSTVTDFAPALVVKLDQEEPDAPYGLVITAVRHEGSRDTSYINSFEAIPCGRAYRLQMREESWPRIEGTLSGRVSTPDDSPYASLSSAGEYTVRFNFDFDSWPAGGESVPLRLAKPFAGGKQTGFHFPLLKDTDVEIAFANGDPNRPYIAHAQHNSQEVDLITSQEGFNTRNVIRTQTGKLRFEDRKEKAGAKLATEFGKTQLNLGFVVDSHHQERGQGFEVRTDQWGAVRAGQGLFLSADAQAQASGQVLEMQAARNQLQAAQARMKSLGEAVSQAKATVAACQEQQTLLQNKIDKLQAAVLLASAPHGVAITSGEHMQLASGGHLFTSTGGNADAAIGGNYTVAAGNAVSLYANVQGMKLYAAAGAVDVQAQGDALNLSALKAVNIASAEDEITINASRTLTLICGGAYIKLSSAGVEIGSPGQVQVKGPVEVTGSATLQKALPLMPKQQETGMQLWHTYINQEAVKNAPYQVLFADGSKRQGTLDDQGRATLTNVPRGGGEVEYFEQPDDVTREANRFKEQMVSAVKVVNEEGGSGEDGSGAEDLGQTSAYSPALAASDEPQLVQE